MPNFGGEHFGANVDRAFLSDDSDLKRPEMKEE